MYIQGNSPPSGYRAIKLVSGDGESKRGIRRREKQVRFKKWENRDYQDSEGSKKIDMSLTCWEQVVEDEDQ